MVDIIDCAGPPVGAEAQRRRMRSMLDDSPSHDNGDESEAGLVRKSASGARRTADHLTFNCNDLGTNRPCSYKGLSYSRLKGAYF